MKILLYTGDLKLVTKSGVGEAVRHQKQILDSLSLPMTEKPKEGYDIAQINTVFPLSVLMSHRARWKHKKVVYYAHSTMEDFMHSFKGSDFFAPLFKRWLIHCYNTADLLITPTDYSKQLLSGYGLKPPIYSLSNGIDSDFFAPDPEAGKRFREKYQIAPDQKVIISVGHYIARKGILDFAELAKRMPEYRFIWFGYTNLNLIPKEIRRVIENPPKNLLFGGYICREELRDAYCGSDAFLFLTHEETEGIVLLEALATGVPVIVRDIPIYKTFLTDGFDVYKGSTLDQFEALVRGAAEKNLPGIETVGENGRKTACTRDMHAVATRLEELYQLVSGGQN